MSRFGVPLREADRIIITNDHNVDLTIEEMVSKGSRFFLIIGPVFSGKTEFQNQFNKTARNMVFLNQAELLKEIAGANTAKDPRAIMEAMARLERTVIEQYMDQPGMSFFKETKGLVQQSRRIIAVDNSMVDVLVFDAPNGLLTIRAREMIKDGRLLYETEASLITKIGKMREGINWPTFKEGFKSINYIGHVKSERDMILHEYLTSSVLPRSK